MKKENLETVGSGKRGNRSLWLAVAVGLVFCLGVAPVVAAEAEAALGDGGFCIVATYPGEKKITGNSGNCAPTPVGPTPEPTPTEEPPIETGNSPETVGVGEIITYTITLRNPTDSLVPQAKLYIDLTDVFDDANLIPGSPSSTHGYLTLVGKTLSFGIDLPPKGKAGSVVTVTYKVMVHGKGNGSLVQRLEPTGIGVYCKDDANNCVITNTVTKL